MKSISFKNEYIEWLKANTKEVQLGKNINRLTAPLLDVNNDCIEIYISKTDTGFILSDDGETISNLELSNVRITGKRKEIIKRLIRSYGVQLSEDGQLFTECSLQNFGVKAHSLMQCMVKVSDMLLFSDNNVRTIFTDEVKKYFEDHSIVYVPDMNLLGRSSYYANYDFCLPKSKGLPERFIKPVNHVTESTIKSTIFTWDGVKGNRSSDSRLYVIINDQKNNAGTDAAKALNEYGIQHIFWSKIGAYLSLLQT